MRPLLTLVILLASLGQTDPDPNTPEAPELVRVLAIHGTNEGQGKVSFDPTLMVFEDVLAKLPYDTFREVAFHEISTAYGAPQSVPLTDSYTYHCQAIRLTEEEEVVLEVHIDRGQGDNRVEALRATGRLARGKGMVFRGFEMPTGELVIVTSVAEPPDPDNDGGGGESRGGDSRGGGANGGDSDTNVDTAGVAGATDAEMMEVTQEIADEREEVTDQEVDQPLPLSTSPSKEEKPLPPELANLEGVLHALEEIDQREQVNARRRHLQSTTKGAWW